MEEIYYALNPWWEKRSFETGVLREPYVGKITRSMNRRQIEVIVGSRRIGKTTLLRQLISHCLNQGISAHDILYLALDHPQLSQATLSEHLRNFRQLFMHSRERRLYLFLDEVQESPHWQLELKSLYDLEPLKVLCTGSTSSLIQRQAGKLTGRQIVTLLYPLSFNEFLKFREILPPRAEGYQYERLFEQYLQEGGYPEQVLTPSQEYLNNLVEDIIARDIVRLYNIRRASLLKDLLILLAGSVGTRISFHQLSKTLGISLDTVKEYVGYLQTAFLVKPMEKWSTSYKDKIYAQKKIYFYDTGIKNLLSGERDLGAKVENTLFMDFVKQGIVCGYYAESEREVDFVCGSVKSPEAVEAKYETRLNWDDKKYGGVKLFLRRYPQTKKITIVSKSAELEFKEGKTTITVIPAWKRLLK